MRPEIKSDATIARRLASQTWGEVQQQEKIADGFWCFDTAGHGGYVADTDKYTLLNQFKTTIVFINARSNKYYPHEQHFAAFEEDCDWAIPLYFYPELCRAAYSKGGRLETFYKRYKTTRQYFDEVVMPCIEHYHTNLLNLQTTFETRDRL